MASEKLTLRECLVADAIEEANDIEVKKLKERIKTLEEALSGILERYVGLVESGDAGSWDAEKEPEVIAARAALGEKP